MHRVETLETRTLLSATFVKGVMTIEGSAGNDSYYVTIGAGNKIHVVDNGTSILSALATDVKKIIFNGNDGNDAFSVNANIGLIPTYLSGGNGDDQLAGASANDTILGGAGRDWLTGNDGNDSIDGGAADDNLAGAKGNDTINGGDGRDLLVGGEGNDLLDGGFDADSIRGGLGSDTVSYANRVNAVFVDLSNAKDEIADDGEAGEKDVVDHDVENILGGAGNDVLTGTVVSESSATTPGFTTNNIIRGNGGNDTINGLDGDDVLDGGLGADILNGGAGKDTADYGRRGENLTLDLDGFADDGAAGEHDKINSDVENISGGTGNDRITGNAKNNVLKGNNGNDLVDGGLGADLVIGGNGTDTADYRTRSEKLALNLDGLANDGAAGELDKIDATIENLYGGAGADSITGNSLANVLRGYAGNDVIKGGAGNDSLYGDAGTDQLYGEAGSDSFYARSAPGGKDIIDGGAGTDRAQTDTLDVIGSIETILA